MKFNKHYLSITLLLIGVIWVACVDIPNDAPTLNPTYIQSLVRFTNFDTGVSTATPVSVDGANVGSLSALGDATSYMVVESGSRTIGFGSFSSAISFGSEQQGTVYIHQADANGSRYSFFPEGSKYWNANPNATVALVRFVNVSNTGAATVTFRDGSASGHPFSKHLAYLGAAPYQEIQPGMHSVYTISGTSYTAALHGQATVGSATVTLDSSLRYTVTVPIDSVTGFYTSASFLKSGTSIFPILTATTPDSIDYGEATLSGASEPDTTLGSDTTQATGTATCYLKPDGTLHYTVVVTPGVPDTTLTMGHFHNAPEGANGPVVRDIFTSPTSSEATFEGVWASTDGQPLTPSLVTALLNGEIYVNVHSTAHPAGAIRVQLTPATTSLTFTGAWPDTAVTQNFLNDLNAGSISVNFQTSGNPGIQTGSLTPSDGVMGGIGVSNIQLDGGKVYTVVSVGVETSMQVFGLVDRQGPSSQKPGVVAKSATKPTN
jgi:CHRD domain